MRSVVTAIALAMALLGQAAQPAQAQEGFFLLAEEGDWSAGEHPPSTTDAAHICALVNKAHKLWFLASASFFYLRVVDEK